MYTKNYVKYFVINLLFVALMLAVGIRMNDLLVKIYNENINETNITVWIGLAGGIFAITGIYFGALIDRGRKRSIKRLFLAIITLQLMWMLASRVIKITPKGELVFLAFIVLLIVTVLRIIIEVLPPIIQEKKFLHFNAIAIIAMVFVKRWMPLRIDNRVIHEYIVEISCIIIVVMFIMVMNILKDSIGYSSRQDTIENISTEIKKGFKSIFRDKVLLQGFLNILGGAVISSITVRVLMNIVFKKNASIKVFGRIDFVLCLSCVGIILVLLFINKNKKSGRIIENFAVVIPISLILFSLNDLFEGRIRAAILSVTLCSIIGVMRVIEIHILTYINENYPKDMQGKLIGIKNALQNMSPVLIIPFGILANMMNSDKEVYIMFIIIALLIIALITWIKKKCMSIKEE